MVHSLLHVIERTVGSIGATEAVGVLFGHGRLEFLEILRRQNHVRVEEKQIVAIGTLKAIVARVAASRIGLIIVVDSKK